ncbi:MAG TPA: TlpA disulfide reductase family protein [Candidatus Acidoferrum sp.]
MRLACMCLALLCVATTCFGDEKKDEPPTNEKAQKTYKEANDLVRTRRLGPALDAFKKADKQDGGHCLACQKEMIYYGTKFGEWKTAELAAQEMIAESHDPQAIAISHYQMASVLMAEGFETHKNQCFTRAHDEITAALTAFSNFPDARFLDGKALAQLHQDDAAKAQFQQFAKTRPENNVDRQRAERFIGNIDLARARMAPPFEVTAMDGQKLSMDELQGKVVLLDFWATWCQPCREALPHIRSIADKFHGEPLVLLSVNLDTDEKKWKDFVAANKMTWPQYFDGGFGGPISKAFAVHEIPHTFTIDADGIVQDEKIGDASIEGKLKKLLARAREIQSTQGR